MNKRHYEHTLPNIRGSLSNTYIEVMVCHKLQKVLPVFLSFRRISKEHKAMGCLYGCIGLFRLLHVITF